MKYRAKFRRMKDEGHDDGRVVKKAGEEWWETLDRDTDDARADAEKLVKWFNNTLTPGQSPRELLEVEVLEGKSDNHHWERMTARDPDGNEIGRCKGCDIKATLKPNFEAKATFPYNAIRLPPYDESQFDSCILVQKTMRAREHPCPTCGVGQKEYCVVIPRKGVYRSKRTLPPRDWPHKARIDLVVLE